VFELSDESIGRARRLGGRPLTLGRTVPTLAGEAPVLKISQKLEYAMRAMIELAARREEAGLVPAREIADAQQVPLRFLEQQLGALHKAGLVQSSRGAGGGCRIAKDPAEIRVSDIADAIEGQLFPMFCLEPSDHTCFQDSQCGLQGFWRDVALAIQRVFEETTVADLLERHQLHAAEARPVFSAEQLLSRLN
jgi:Rrf2 family protein